MRNAERCSPEPSASLSSESNGKTPSKRSQKKTVHRIADDLKENGKADVLKWWKFMTSDISGELMFGESWDMLGKEQVRRCPSR